MRHSEFELVLLRHRISIKDTKDLDLLLLFCLVR